MAKEITRPEIFGRDLFGDVVVQSRPGPLAQRFEFPPFTVLNARDGDWQARKRAWLSMGIKSEIGRADNLTFSDSIVGRPDKYRDYGTLGTTSIFDPVLTEIVYRWFCPPGGQIIDPFAGGSVRGIVAALLGFKYHGIELRPEQVLANIDQRATIAPGLPVRWEQGDAMDKVVDAPEADFIFSCPPYGDLERYSDDPADLSTMEYNTFIAALGRIVLRCAGRLRNNRLACFVVGDFRDPLSGMYRGFVSDTVQLFRNAGLQLYNDAILMTPCGTLPVRTSAQFAKGRKLGKTHQNVLVFAKGDPREAFKEI